MNKIKQKIIIPAMLMLIMPICAQAESDWDFHLTPYIWFAGVKGDVATVPGASVIPIDISASDTFSDTEASFMLLFEAKTGRHGVLVDVLYSDLQSDTDLIPEINLTLKSTSKTSVFSTAYMYELYKKEQTVVDVFAGARYWKIDTELEFGGGLGFLQGKRVRHGESWLDPLIGVKARTALGDSQFYVSGGVAAGGFGVGSDSFYDITANIGYQWSEAIGTSLGYRMFDLDYEDDWFVYDVKQQGWLLGLTWGF